MLSATLLAQYLEQSSLSALSNRYVHACSWLARQPDYPPHGYVLADSASHLQAGNFLTNSLACIHAGMRAHGKALAQQPSGMECSLSSRGVQGPAPHTCGGRCQGSQP